MLTLPVGMLLGRSDYKFGYHSEMRTFSNLVANPLAISVIMRFALRDGQKHDRIMPADRWEDC